jgi:hypothetical protein
MVVGYFSTRPLKSALCLLLSVFFRVFYLSYFTPFWVYYFLAFLFLRGILVIVVIISGFSEYSGVFFHHSYFLYFLLGFYPFLSFFPESSGLSKFYS